ncbi:MAG: hypothetical protein HYW07_23400 [Candidatus Latescibacteria bacterium]|nr:hypothetical protein [Candidatus Latescibacterota bacterium]
MEKIERLEFSLKKIKTAPIVKGPGREMPLPLPAALSKMLRRFPARRGAGMTETEQYLFDVHGYLVIKGALSAQKAA